MNTARALVNILLNPRCEVCRDFIVYDDWESSSRVLCKACEEDRGSGNIPEEEEEDEEVDSVVAHREVAKQNRG